MKGERVFVYLALFAIFIATITATDREEYKGHQVIKYEINSQRYLEFLEDLENTPSLLHFYEIWHEKKVNGETVQFDIQVQILIFFLFYLLFFHCFYYTNNSIIKI